MTAMLIVVMRPLARIIGLVDVPDARKTHSGSVPLVGGIAIFLSVLALCLVSLWTGRPLVAAIPQLLSFLAGGLLLVGIGLADDFLELSARVRFLAQAMAALIMAFGGGVELADLGAMSVSGRVVELGLLTVPFTIFATIGVINALNMCDGLDGLSGSQALVSLSGFLLALLIWGEPADATLLAGLGGGIAGFLLFNLRLPGRTRASVFLGDAGSMFLGFALAWFAISLSQGPERIINPAAALWFVMVPVIDAVAIMLRRILKGRSPFAPDREHLHHIFLLAGYSVSQTVAIMAGLGAAGVAIGLACTWWDVPDLLVAGSFLGLGLLYFWMIMHAWRVQKFLHRPICRRRNAQADRRVTRDDGQGCRADQRYQGHERRCGGDRRQASPKQI